ncbi:TetR/AcrR family transcriptional regulator [Desertivirga xinjiangensis]|uniref:TetR/AcrR family transcriptional regulator n=1 Tax=Desertivirga xinjiangensis TaxID=539206 RepID=UPI00210DA366|nr:TetR/AcrR family transcriptional regulator [Pedobacter xinjiangensis]
MENQDRKREQIIEAAVKRFAHFGLAKTTMTEIASDLSLSKALLYYYFPDKINLYAAVLENIINIVSTDIEEKMRSIKDPQEALAFYIDRRHYYIKKYYNILDFLRTAGTDLPPQVIKTLEDARNTEVRQISMAIQKKEIDLAKATEAASLLIDAFLGMRMALFSRKKTFLINDEEFDIVLRRQKQLGQIFMNGL